MPRQRPEVTHKEALDWVQNEVHQVKAQVGRLQQQADQVQALVLDLAEKVRSLDNSLRQTAAQAAPVDQLQEGLHQALALIVKLQEQQADVSAHEEEMSRQRRDETEHLRQERDEVVRQLQELSHQVEGWQERQAGLEETGRRYQEGLARLGAQLQELTRRLEAVEGKASRSLEASGRVEHDLSRVDSALEALRHEGEVLTERARLASEVARRLEATQDRHREDYRRLDLLAERIELYRAERQRLEERTARLEEALEQARGRLEQDQQQTGLLQAQQQGHAARLEGLERQILEYRETLVDQFSRMSSTQERVKRRQIEELEREIKEMKQHAAGLTEE